MLRRTKDELKETTSFDLPPKTFNIIKVDLFDEEKNAYEKVLQFSRLVKVFPVIAFTYLKKFLVHCLPSIYMKKLIKKMLSNVVFQ